MPRSNDDELTDPGPIGFAETYPAEMLTRSCAWHFRCTRCEIETLTDEAVSSAPRCPNCDRYMAPVNTKRGAA